MNPVIDKIWLENLNCEVDAQRIQQSLNTITGVIQVKTNCEEGWLEVEHDDFTDLESICIKLAEIGHPVADTIAPVQWNL